MSFLSVFNRFYTHFYNVLFVFSAVFLCIIPTACHFISLARKTPPLTNYNSLLWQISGNGLSRPSYLFGTVHLIPAADYVFSTTAQQAFRRSEQLCLEINTDDPDMITAATKVYLPDSVSIQTLLSPKDYRNLSTALQSKGLSVDLVKNMKPILLSALLLERQATEPLMTYEAELQASAKTQKKKIVALESPFAQMSMLDSINYTEQVHILLQTLYNGDTEMKDLIASYKTNHIDSIYEHVIDKTTLTTSFNRILLTERNAAWIPLLNAMMRQKSTFIAVGAGHLGGAQGLVRRLQHAGFVLKPLY